MVLLNQINISMNKKHAKALYDVSKNNGLAMCELVILSENQIIEAEAN